MEVAVLKKFDEFDDLVCEGENEYIWSEGDCPYLSGMIGFMLFFLIPIVIFSLFHLIG